MLNLKKNRSLWFWLTVAGFFVLFFYFYVLSFSPLPEQDVVKLYYVDNISATHQLLIDRFNEQYVGQIEVVPVNLPFSKFSTNERKEILARSLRSKSEKIDVFAVDIIWTQRFSRWSLALDPYFSEEWKQKFLRQSLNTCFYKNKLMAAPLYLDVGLLYYRDDLLQKLPDYEAIKQKLNQRMSWEAFLALGKRLSGSGRPVFLFPANNFEGLMCVFYELLTPEQIAATFLADSIDLHKPEIVAALQHLHHLIHRDRLTPSVVTGFDEVECYNYLLQHDGYFVRGWPGFEFSVQEYNQQTQKNVRIGVAPVPYFRTKSARAIYGGWNLMVSENSQHKDEAIQFIKFLQEAENQKLLFSSGHYLPALKAVYQDSAFLARFPRLELHYRLLQNGQHRPMRSDYTRVSDILSFYFHQALRNEVGIEQALEMAENEINSHRTNIN
ncbi:extracellular solute-binding protein [Calditrichota bacterium LG25]